MVEYIVTLNSLPPIGATVIIDSKLKKVGGPPYNLCFYFSQFKQPCRLVGVYGETENSLIANTFSNLGIESSTLIKVEGDTDFLVVFVSNGYEKTTSLYFRNDLPRGTDKKILKRCEYATDFVITGSRHQEIRRVYLKLIRHANKRFIAFNPSYAITEYDRKELLAIIERCDVTLFNKSEAVETCKILGVNREEELPKVTPGSIITTLGSEGVRMYEGNEVHYVPSRASTVSNVIGGGDALFAGFLYKMLNGSKSLDALRFGNALASLVVESDDVRVFITEAEVAERIEPTR